MLTNFTQIEVKVRVEELRRQRKEEDRQREIEEMFKAEMEKEEKKRLAQQEIARFRERVSMNRATTPNAMFTLDVCVCVNVTVKI